MNRGCLLVDVARECWTDKSTSFAKLSSPDTKMASTYMPFDSVLLLLAAILMSNPNIVHETNPPSLLHYVAAKQWPEFCQLLVDANSNLVSTA